MVIQIYLEICQFLLNSSVYLLTDLASSYKLFLILAMSITIFSSLFITALIWVFSFFFGLDWLSIWPFCLFSWRSNLLFFGGQENKLFGPLIFVRGFLLLLFVFFGLNFIDFCSNIYHFLPCTNFRFGLFLFFWDPEVHC